MLCGAWVTQHTKPSCTLPCAIPCWISDDAPGPELRQEAPWHDHDKNKPERFECSQWARLNKLSKWCKLRNFTAACHVINLVLMLKKLDS